MKLTSVFSSETSYLGIDIGTSSIKLVELKKEKGTAKLVTYGFSESPENKFNYDWQNHTRYSALALNKIYKETGAISRSAISALPTFSVFSSVLNLSNIAEKDIGSAVHWEAKKVIPLPLEEMILDWKRIASDDKDAKNFKVLLTGAPKALVKKYINIFKEAKINLLSLETETFSLIRSLLGNDKSSIMLVELGSSTTDITIINKSIPVLNRSIDVGGLSITKAVSKKLNMSLGKAEQFKYDLGINKLNSNEKDVPELITKTIDPIINEIKYALNLYQNKNNLKIEKIVLSGGSALLINFTNFLSNILDMKVIVGDPWSRITVPEELKPVLNEIGPRMSVAVGLALREME